MPATASPDIQSGSELDVSAHIYLVCIHHLLGHDSEKRPEDAPYSNCRGCISDCGNLNCTDFIGVPYHMRVKVDEICVGHLETGDKPYIPGDSVGCSGCMSDEKNRQCPNYSGVLFTTIETVPHWNEIPPEYMDRIKTMKEYEPLLRRI